jgi:hypothetical protein
MDTNVAIKLPTKFSRTPKAPRTFLTQKEVDTFPSTAAVIRAIKAKFPDATNGEIARFCNIRPQWVFNVLTNPPKGK